MPTGFDLRQIENVIDQFEQIARVPRYAFEAASMTIVQLERTIIQHQRREPDDGVHRRSKLVRHVGEESRFGLALEREPPVLLGKHAVALFEFRARHLAGFGAAAEL